MLDSGEVPASEMNKIARFLEGQGYKELALDVAEDREQRFELALGLGRLEICLELAREADVEHKWKTVGDAALTAWDIKLAEECFLHARDLGSLLLLYSSSADASGLRDLASKAREAGQHNVAFTCLWQVGDIDACLDILIDTNRTAEAVLFAQTYRPSRCRSVVEGWKSGLEKNGKGKVGRILGLPPDTDGAGEDDEEMFPKWQEWLSLEKEGGTNGQLIDVDHDSDANGVAEVAAKAQESLAALSGDPPANGDDEGATTTEVEV